MTIYSGPTQGPLVGAQISPAFGVQNAGSAPANTQIAVPAGMSTLEAEARGILPANALVTSVNGVSVGNGDLATVAELLSNGNGESTNRGASIAPAGALNTQIFVDGITDKAAVLANGPAPTDTSTLTEAPVSAATLGSNVSLTANGFGG